MKITFGILALSALLLFGSGCGDMQASQAPQKEQTIEERNTTMNGHFTQKTPIKEVMESPVFKPYGRLLFPVHTGYWNGHTLEDLRLIWYCHIDPKETTAIVNDLWERAQQKETVFYDIYSVAEKAADPRKKDTGLFFFKGRKGAPFAVVNAGGGFIYVGAMHDSFPHAYELSKRGYNAFALIYRPARKRPAKTWRGPSASSLPMRMNWALIPRTIPFGAVRQGPAWRPTLALTARSFWRE